MMFADPLEFYTNHGPMSDPGEYTSWFSDLPDDSLDFAK